MRWVTGLLLGAVTSAVLGNQRLIRNTYEGPLPSFIWAAHEAARSPGGPGLRKMEIPDISNANSERIVGDDEISGVISESGDSSGTIAILTADDDTAKCSYTLYAMTAPDDERTAGSIDQSLTRGSDDAFRLNDLVALTRDYERISERYTVGDGRDGNGMFDQLMPAGGRYGESVPREDVLADDAAEPVGEAGGLVKWVGGAVLMILITATGIGIRERKSHRI